MKKNQFDLEHLKKIADHTLDYAKKIGATASEVEVSFGTGKNISVRLGNLETLEINRDKGLSSPKQGPFKVTWRVFSTALHVNVLGSFSYISYIS